MQMNQNREHVGSDKGVMINFSSEHRVARLEKVKEILDKGCFLNLVPTFPLVNQWKMMSTITKNIQN
eukprot:UN04586